MKTSDASTQTMIATEEQPATKEGDEGSKTNRARRPLVDRLEEQQALLLRQAAETLEGNHARRSHIRTCLINAERELELAVRYLSETDPT